MRVRFHNSYADIDPSVWDRLIDSECPFTRHAFLLLMERHAGESHSWRSMPLSISDADGETVWVMPLYAREDSFGEYVFDYLWANAYHRAGLPYYPKLISAVPFSPIESPRWGAAPGADVQALLELSRRAIAERAADGGYSSWHILYPPERALGELRTAGGFALRPQCRFAWDNRGYGSFDDWLGEMQARKRKSVRRERRIVRDAGLRVEALPGGDVTPWQWREFYAMYQSSYLKRGMYPYLPLQFFEEMAEAMPESVVLFRVDDAERPGECLAASLCLRDGEQLYGRYWGCLREVDCLHFEVCYYATVEYCIAEGLVRFDSGVQGEHTKVPRGFAPHLAHSVHWFAHPEFARAVGEFIQREARHVKAHCGALAQALPYRRSGAAGAD
ncbi:MAG: GNAT family N-acetyltransferase [Gammaproteobacteria bacterium AqS3]|nr:GNAT family N-acetyltransferase [Gammaproteobacteria bacterium AqS3]